MTGRCEVHLDEVLNKRESIAISKTWGPPAKILNDLPRGLSLSMDCDHDEMWSSSCALTTVLTKWMPWIGEFLDGFIAIDRFIISAIATGVNGAQ